MAAPPNLCSAQKLVEQYPNIPCTGYLNESVPSGDYGMWNVDITHSKCLQSLSDTLVEALSSYITPNQTIPDWVLQLPEPLRSEKIGWYLHPHYNSPKQLSSKNMDRPMSFLNFNRSTYNFVDRHAKAFLV